MTKKESIAQVATVLNGWLIKRILVNGEVFEGKATVRVPAKFTAGWHGCFGSVK